MWICGVNLSLSPLSLTRAVAWPFSRGRTSWAAVWSCVTTTPLCRPWDGVVLKWAPCMCNAARESLLCIFPLFLSFQHRNTWPSPSLCVVLCVTSSQDTGEGSTSWSVRGIAETISTGETGVPTARPLRSSPSAESSTKSSGSPGDTTPITLPPDKHTLHIHTLTLFFLTSVFLLLGTCTSTRHTYHHVLHEGAITFWLWLMSVLTPSGGAQHNNATKAKLGHIPGGDWLRAAQV